MFGKKSKNKDKDKVRNLRVVSGDGEKDSDNKKESTDGGSESSTEQPVAGAPADIGNSESVSGETPDELTELCRIAWCESFYRLADGFSFKEDFIKDHLAPFVKQAGVDLDKMEDEEKARALISLASYIVCRALAQPLEAIGLKKETPQLYSQAMYQTIAQAAQQAFVSIVDEYSFRTPFLPFANVFAQAVFKQNLDDVAIAYLFGPAYEITLRRALFMNKWIILPDSSSEDGSEEAEEPKPDDAE